MDAVLAFCAMHPHPSSESCSRTIQARQPIGPLGTLAAAALAALCALTVAAPAAAAPAGAAEDPQQGWRIMLDVGSGNCIGCHALPGQPGLASSFAPPLAGVASRMAAAELRQWVFDARRIKADTLMPPFGTIAGLNRPGLSRPILTERQIEQVVAALQTLR